MMQKMTLNLFLLKIKFTMPIISFTIQSCEIVTKKVFSEHTKEYLANTFDWHDEYKAKSPESMF